MSDTEIALNQYLTFTLDEEQYALKVSRVREVLEFTTVTKVPKTQEFMRGVINLRGNVVPVVDLRLKFDMPETRKTVDTSIIVMEIMMQDEMITLGVLADSVQEVIDLQEDSIEPPPKIGNRINAEFIEGIGKQNDHFIIILNIDKIFSYEELSAVN
ncbi:MAG: chemotaxis protein CheW, partial [Spirochaetia bacterium]